MTLSKQYFVRNSDICILRYNGKSLFRCFGYSKTNGCKILGGLFFTEDSYHNIVKCVWTSVKLCIILLLLRGNRRQPAVMDDKISWEETFWKKRKLDRLLFWISFLFVVGIVPQYWPLRYLILAFDIYWQTLKCCHKSYAMKALSLWNGR